MKRRLPVFRTLVPWYPMSLAAVTQVATSIGGLKSRYLKYLEAFCAANGIDVADVKKDGQSLQRAELFFGGIPVLIGLKYFENLTVLQIVGHEITSLKPLVEVAGTLEELWICEGPLKDLSGIETCTRLKKLYLYDNLIENCRQLTELSALSLIQLDTNRIADIRFLLHLPYLGSLSMTKNCLTDATLLEEGSHWPRKLHHLDLSENKIGLFMSFFPVAVCSTLRSLSFFPSPSLSPSTTRREDYYAWAAHHFHFIEHLDGDALTDEFVKRYMSVAASRLSEAWIELLLEEQRLKEGLMLIDKHSSKIVQRLKSFIHALEKHRDSLPIKDTRREVIKHVLEFTSTNQKSAISHRRSWRDHTRLLRALSHHTIATKLEGASVETFRTADEATLRTLEHWANYNSTSKHLYELKLRLCLTRRSLGKQDLDRLYYVDCDSLQRVFSDRAIIHVMQRHIVSNFRLSPLRIWKDFEITRKELDEKKKLVNVVLVCQRQNASAITRKTTDEITSINVMTDSDASDNGAFPTPSDSSALGWTDLSVVAVATVEICSKSELRMDDLHNMETFDRKFHEQMERLKEINIKLDLKDDHSSKGLTRNHSSSDSLREDSSLTLEEVAMSGTLGGVPGARCVRAVRDVLSPPFLSTRWLVSSPLDATNATTVCTTRSPIEIALCYGIHAPARDIVDFKNTVTVLDLSSMNLSKLSGIDDLPQLTCLSLRNNKLATIGKIAKLRNLYCLDVSENKITKIEELPEMMTHLVVDGNRLSSLHFCHKLQVLDHFSAAHNQIKSLKGLEKSKQLRKLLLSENAISTIDDVQSLKNLSMLTFLDLRGNAVEHAENYRNSVLSLVRSLECLDLQKAPVGMRSNGQSKTVGRALTMDFILKTHPSLSTDDSLNCSNAQLEIVSMEPGDVDKLSHIYHVDLSTNCLRQLGDLVEMANLKSLDLSGNRMASIFSDSEYSAKTLSSLNRLNLSSNEARFARNTGIRLFISHTLARSLSNAALLSLQLQRLSTLTSLNLSRNRITKLDFGLFAAFPNLEQLDMSNNEIKMIHKASMPRLRELILSGNRIKDLAGLNGAVALEILDVSNNRLMSLAALKCTLNMHLLKSLDCTGNGVTERRVYASHLRNQARNTIRTLEILDRQLLSPSEERSNAVATTAPQRTRSRSVHYSVETKNNWDCGGASMDLSQFSWAASATPLDIVTPSFNQRWSGKRNS